MESVVSPFSITAYIDTHYSTKNLLFFIGTDSVKIDVYYFHENSYSGDSRRWGGCLICTL